MSVAWPSGEGFVCRTESGSASRSSHSSSPPPPPSPTSPTHSQVTDQAGGAATFSIGRLDDDVLHKFVGNAPWLPLQQLLPSDGLCAHSVAVLNIPASCLYAGSHMLGDLRCEASGDRPAHRDCVNQSVGLLKVLTLLTEEVTERLTDNGSHLPEKLAQKEHGRPVSRFFTFLEEGVPAPMFTYYAERLRTEKGLDVGWRVWKVVHDKYHDSQRSIFRMMVRAAEQQQLMLPESFSAKKKVSEKDRLKANADWESRFRYHYTRYYEVNDPFQLFHALTACGLKPSHMRSERSGLMDLDPEYQNQAGDHPCHAKILDPLRNADALTASLDLSNWEGRVCDAQRDVRNYLQRDPSLGDDGPARFCPVAEVCQTTGFYMLSPHDLDPLTTPLPPVLPDAGWATSHCEQMYRELVACGRVPPQFFPPTPGQLGSAEAESTLKRSMLLYLHANEDETLPVRFATLHDNLFADAQAKANAIVHRRRMLSFPERIRAEREERILKDGHMQVTRSDPINVLRVANARIERVFLEWCEMKTQQQQSRVDCTQLDDDGASGAEDMDVSGFDSAVEFARCRQAVLAWQITKLKDMLATELDDLPTAIRNRLLQGDALLTSCDGVAVRIHASTVASEACRTVFGCLCARDLAIFQECGYEGPDMGAVGELISQCSQQLQSTSQGYYPLLLQGLAGSGRSRMTEILMAVAAKGVIQRGGSESAMTGRNGVNSNDLGVVLYDETHPLQHTPDRESQNRRKELLTRRETTHTRVVDAPTDGGCASVRGPLGQKVEVTMKTATRISEIICTNESAVPKYGEEVTIEAIVTRQKTFSFAAIGKRKRVGKQDENISSLINRSPSLLQKVREFRMLDMILVHANLLAETTSTMAVPMEAAGALMEEMDEVLFSRFRVPMPKPRDWQRRNSMIVERVIRTACCATFFGAGAKAHAALWLDDERSKPAPFSVEQVCCIRPLLIPSREIINHVYFLELRFRQIYVFDQIALAAGRLCGFQTSEPHSFAYKERGSERVHSACAVDDARLPDAGGAIQSEERRNRYVALRGAREHELSRLENPRLPLERRFAIQKVMQWFGPTDALTRSLCSRAPLTPQQKVQGGRLAFVQHTVGNTTFPRPDRCYVGSAGVAGQGESDVLAAAVKEIEKDAGIQAMQLPKSSWADAMWRLRKVLWDRHSATVPLKLIEHNCKKVGGDEELSDPHCVGGTSNLKLDREDRMRTMSTTDIETRIGEALDASIRRCNSPDRDQSADEERDFFQALAANYAGDETKTEPIIDVSTAVAGNKTRFVNFSVSWITFHVSLCAEARLHMLDCCLSSHDPTILQTFGLHDEGAPQSASQRPSPLTTDGRTDGLPFSPSLMLLYRMMVCVAATQTVYKPPPRSEQEERVPSCALPEPSLTSRRPFVEYVPKTSSTADEFVAAAEQAMRESLLCCLDEDVLLALGDCVMPGTCSDAVERFARFESTGVPAPSRPVSNMGLNPRERQWATQSRPVSERCSSSVAQPP